MKKIRVKMYAAIMVSAVAMSFVSDMDAEKFIDHSTLTSGWYRSVTGTVSIPTYPSANVDYLNPPVCVTNPSGTFQDLYGECEFATPKKICGYYVETGTIASDCPTPPPGQSKAVVTRIYYGEYAPY